MSLQVEVGRTGLFIQIDETVLNLNTSQITVVSGNADTLNGQTSAYYLNRANHTGTQAISTVSGLEEALDDLSEADSDLGGQIVAIQNALPLKADLVGGVVPTAQIPAIAITELLTLAGGVLPASEAQMLTLRGQTGDFTIRTDVSTQYIIVSGDGSLIGNWLAMPQASSPVLSVNGQTGVVVLGRADVGINSSDDIPEGVSNLYWNAQRTRDTTLTGFTATNSPIISTDNIVQAFGKAQGQINATKRDSFDYFAYLGDRWLPPETTNSLVFSVSPWAALHNAAVIPAVQNAALMYALLDFDLCAFPTAQADGNLVLLVNGVVVNSTISSSFGNTNYFARIQLEIFRRVGGSIGYQVRSSITGSPLFRGTYAPVTPVPFGIDLSIELRFRPTGFNSVEHVSTTNCTLAVKRVQNGSL